MLSSFASRSKSKTCWTCRTPASCNAALREGRRKGHDSTDMHVEGAVILLGGQTSTLIDLRCVRYFSISREEGAVDYIMSNPPKG